MNKQQVSIISGVLLCFLCSTIYGQRVDVDTKLADSIRSKVDKKTHVACVKSSVEFTFKYLDSKKAISPVCANENIDETIIALKDNTDFTGYIPYDDYSDVGEVKAYGKNNRPADIIAVDVNNTEEGIFYGDDQVKVFQLPFSDYGQKLRYTAKMIYGDLKYIHAVYFMEDYPYREKTITFYVPQWLKVDFKEMNFEGYNITKNVTTDAQGTTIYTYTAKNIPRWYTDEKDVPNASGIMPHIVIMCKSYTTPKGENRNLISSMGDLYGFIDSLARAAGNNDENIKPLVNQIIAGKTTDTDKVKALYYWVQDNIRYIAFENGIMGLKPFSCQTVYKNKYGDCKGMANLLVVMLRDAGFDARHTWIGTKGIAYDFSTPILGLFNHAICTLILNGKKYYLDGTESYAAFGDNADRIQGRPVLIEDGKNFIEDKIPVASIERSKIDMNIDMTLSGTEILTGHVDVTYCGESKTQILDEYNHTASSEHNAVIKDMAEGSNKDIEVSKVTISDMQNREIPVKLQYDFTEKNQVSTFDNDIYINLDQHQWFRKFDFDSTRHYDYEFDYRYNIGETITFTMPDGYSVKHVPDNVNKTTPDYTFTITFTQQGNKIIYRKQIIMNNEIVKSTNFKTWNEAIKELRKAYDDQVVIAKK